METQTIKVGRKTIKVYHTNFQYYQPNVHEGADCVVRAICKMTNKSWYDVFDALCATARKMQRMPHETEVITETLRSWNYSWHPMKATKGMKRFTVADFAETHEEWAIMDVAGHVVASGLGVYYDTWDCGDKSVYGYWGK